MNKHFNLLDEPWVPVRFHSGEVRELGLREVFAQAGNIATLAETSPPNLIALYRLLLAITHRALVRSKGSWKDRDRAEWYRNGLPVDAIHDYLEQWRERFWLFHPESPFMQVAALAWADETCGVETLKPWTQLQLECIGSDTLFEHRVDATPRQISAAEAIRALLGYLQFVPGGMVRRFRFRDESGPLDNVAAIVPIGSNICQTIALALGTPGNTKDIDLASWEISPILADDIRNAKSTIPNGPVDTFTRITRSVLFELETGIEGVRRLRFGPGLTIDSHTPNFPDRMAAYRKREGDRITPITFQDGRAFWRDLPSILPVNNRIYISPSIVEYATGCLLFAETETPLRFLVAGTASDPIRCKIFRWRMETVTLPQSFFSNPALADELRYQIERAEDIYYRKEEGLSYICGDLIAESMPDPSNAHTRKRAREVRAAGPCAPAFFTAAERSLPSLMELIGNGDIEAADAMWREALATAVESAWQVTSRSLGQSAAALRAEAVSHWKLSRLLKELRGDSAVHASAQHNSRSTSEEEAHP